MRSGGLGLVCVRVCVRARVCVGGEGVLRARAGRAALTLATKGNAHEERELLHEGSIDLVAPLLLLAPISAVVHDDGWACLGAAATFLGLALRGTARTQPRGLARGERHEGRRAQPKEHRERAVRLQRARDRTRPIAAVLAHDALHHGERRHELERARSVQPRARHPRPRGGRRRARARAARPRPRAPLAPAFARRHAQPRDPPPFPPPPPPSAPPGQRPRAQHRGLWHHGYPRDRHAAAAPSSRHTFFFFLNLFPPPSFSYGHSGIRNRTHITTHMFAGVFRARAYQLFSPSNCTQTVPYCQIESREVQCEGRHVQ